MYKLKLIVFICFLSQNLFAQQFGNVSGTVKIEHNNNVLPYAQIVIDEISIGTVTDEEGKFILQDVPIGKHQLKVMFAGYRSEILDIIVDGSSTNSFNFFLTESPISIEEILVTGISPIALASNEYSMGGIGNSPNDIGEFFKSVPGASAVKKGGFAMDPVIRGFKMDQLNVQIDGGSKCWGGCPNRMDPPTSHIQSNDLDKIEVLKGPFSVRWGPTMGGIVNLVMQRPQINTSFAINGKLSGGYELNGNSHSERITITGGSEKIDFYLGSGQKIFGNYTTGGENIEIPSKYNMQDYSIKLGVNPNIDNRFQISWRQSFASDISYPALPMDAATDDTDLLALDYSARNINKILSSITSKVYYSTVYHEMNNFDRLNFKMVEAETIADAVTYGGRLDLGFSIIEGGKLNIGGDYYSHSKDGNRTRFVKTNPCNTDMHPNKVFIDGVWQDSEITNTGIFGEYMQLISNEITLNGGVRYDIVKASINDPSTQFTEAYGTIGDFVDNNLSFTGSVKYLPSINLNSILSYGRGIRSADITERFINHLPVGKSPHEHFGNPNLKPEINDQIELAINGEMNNHRIGANVFFSQLSNYILAQVDSSMGRLYLPCSSPKFTKVFSNVDKAYQYGTELHIHGNLIEKLSYNASVAYLIGYNVDIDEPLPEIAPLTTNIGLKYTPMDDAWVEFNGRFVSAQNRISETYGETQTDGFNIFNIAGGYNLKNIFLRIDILNLFDTKYYDHLNRSFAKNIEDSGLPYYEPGRNITANIEIIF